MDSPEVVSLRSIIDEELGYPNIFFGLSLYPDPVELTHPTPCLQERVIDDQGAGRLMSWIVERAEELK